LSLGGLHIIGTERHEARRIDNQLRGRAGRQGDPGSSQFYVALDDDLMNRFGGEKVKSLMHMAGVDENTPIQNKMVSKSIQSAQVKVEAFHFDMRKHLVEYDDVINTHREVIYDERDKVLAKTNLRPNIESMLGKEIQNILDSETPTPESPNANSAIYDSIVNVFPRDNIISEESINQMSKADIERYFDENLQQIYDQFENTHSPGLIRALEQNLMIRVLDNHWVNHLTSMEALRQGIGLQAFGQRDPLVAYKREGHSKFQELLDKIQHDVVYMLFNINIVKNNPVTTPNNSSSPDSQMASLNSTNRSQAATKVKTSKVGRNSVCPCGSGKKYKRCHGE
jgi:preprotein translocase subunit SecA